MAPEVQSPAGGSTKRPTTAHSAAREQGSRHGSLPRVQPPSGGWLGDDLVGGWDDFKRQTGVLFLNRPLRAEPQSSGRRGVLNVAVDDTAAAPQVSGFLPLAPASTSTCCIQDAQPFPSWKGSRYH